MGAFGRQLGLSLSPERAASWTAAGWTVDDAHTVATLAATAVADRSFLGRRYRSDAPGLAKRLGDVVVAWYVHCGLSPDEVLAWLSVLVAAPTAEHARALEDIVEGGRASRRAAGSAAPETVRWRELPVGLGPLAWAAGLDAEEARSGSYDDPELRVLAALGGFALDPDPPRRRGVRG